MKKTKNEEELLKKRRRRQKFWRIMGILLVFSTDIGFAFNIANYFLNLSSQTSNTFALTILLVVIISALTLTVNHFVIRYFTDVKPTKEILAATETIKNGNFNIRLVPKHEYEHYNLYDQIKDNINQMAVALSKNEVLKTDFISNVSHEIKTPLANIKNYSTLLRDSDLPQEKREEYSIALSATSQRLADLIVNILKLSKLENQEIAPSYDKVNLQEVLEESIVQYEAVLDEKKINLELSIDDLSLISERSYIEIIFNNLLSNAIKFTPENGNISLSLHQRDDEIDFTITDTGCGMSQEALNHIFDKFYQGDTSHAKEGNGLGLALVKKVVEILGGTIKVTSTVNKGSTFTILLKEKKTETSDIK